MRKRLHPANKEARALLKRRINMGAFEVPTRDIFTREKTTLVPFWYDWAEPRNVLYITKSTETILYNLLHSGGYDCIKITASFVARTTLAFLKPPFINVIGGFLLLEDQLI